MQSSVGENENEKVLEMNGGDGCITMYLMSLNLTIVKMLNFMLCYHNKKKKKVFPNLDSKITIKLSFFFYF